MLINVHRIITIATCVIMVIATPVFAADLTQEEFVRKASLSNLFEIETSQLAIERAQKKEVKDFANLMIKDHTKAGEDLKAAVKKAGLDATLVASALDEKHQEKLNTLRNEEANSFDGAYMEMQEDAHDDAVALFKKYARNAEANPLKDFATKTLSILKEHEKTTDSMD